MQLGMEGLMLESHPDPDNALSDPDQQVTPEASTQLVAQLKVPAGMGDNHHDKDALDGLRMQMSVDEQLLQLLSQRMELARTIGS